MQKSLLFLFAAAPLVWACGGSVPAPTQRLADAQSAERSARELGAEEQPRAQLSLKLAQDQIAEAQTAMEAGDNARADSLLMRAHADATLAISQAREKGAKADHLDAVQEADAQKVTNARQGAVK
jgi:hypothetical protein